MMVKKGLMPVLRTLLLSIAMLAIPAATGAVSDATLAPGAYRWMDDAEGGADMGDGAPLYMVISIEAQMVHVYRGDRLIGAASVSTGMKGHRTPTGEFPILQKRQWHRSNIYSNAPMPFMQRLTWDGIALHAGHNPGYPASHGCIRLPYAFAQKLFTLTRIGTLAQVTTDRLSAAIRLDPLVTGDPGSSIVTFTPGQGRSATLPPPDRDDVPTLEVDMSIFRWR